MSDSISTAPPSHGGSVTPPPTRLPVRSWLQPLIVSSLIAAAFICMYVGLQRDPTPREIPIAVVGSQLADSVSGALGNAVSVTRVADEGVGTELLRRRDVVAMVSSPSTMTLNLDVGGANGPSTVGAVEQLVGVFGRSTGMQVVTDDVVPLVRYDSRGIAGFYVAFGVTLASFVLAQMLIMVSGYLHLRHRLSTVTVFAILVGVMAAVLAGPVLGALPGRLVPLAITLALLSAATALATKALGAWFGAVGIPIATVLLITVGNSTSGATVGTDLLPGLARVIGQILPPGAAIQSVTDIGYFGGAHQWVGWLVLIAWIIVAGALIALKHRSGRVARGPGHRRGRSAPIGP